MRRGVWLLPIFVVATVAIYIAGAHTNPADTDTPTPTPSPTRDPNIPLNVVSLSPTVTATQFAAAAANEATDVIELAGGTYRTGPITLNVERTRPLTIRPKAGASVEFEAGTTGATGSAFWIGLGGIAGGITIEGLVFDGYSVGTSAVIWLGNCHDITINDVVVRNSTGPAGYAWALYVSEDAGVAARNVVANDWTVDGNGRTLGALQIGHLPGAQGVTASGWHVANASYAIYSGTAASGVRISDWTIDSSGLNNLSVDLVNTSGTIRNVHATNSGRAEIVPPMVDAGGNSWQ